MKKNRIATRIKDKTGILKSKNRSGDLVVLREQYALFVKNLKFLIATLTNKQTAMMNHSKARLEVAKAINSLTVESPLFKCAGDIPAGAVGTTDGGVGLRVGLVRGHYFRTFVGCAAVGGAHGRGWNVAGALEQWRFHR